MFIRHCLHRLARRVVPGTAVLMAAVLAAVPSASPAWGADGVAARRAKMLKAALPAITAALPAEAAVKPKQPRKLLVFNTERGHHMPAAVAAKAMELMGQKTGAWSTTISDDPAVFEAECLKGFDAVCLNNTSLFNLFGDVPPKTAAKEERAAAAAIVNRREEAFLAFVRGGKGVIGFHGAAHPRSGKILPELFSALNTGHPWRAHDKVGIRIDDPKHALTKSFAGESFDIVDEIYQFTDKSHADFRKKLRVLLTLDMTRTPPKGDRLDQDYAVAWVKKVGQGRLFYSSLGHNADVFWNPKILRFYQDGIQFALGDLEADMRPSAEVGIAPPPASVLPSETKTKK
jgi:type 1 glutamine amidotransferase